MERSKKLSSYGQKGAQIKKAKQNSTLEATLEAPYDECIDSPPEAKTRQEKTRL